MGCGIQNRAPSAQGLPRVQSTVNIEVLRSQAWSHKPGAEGRSLLTQDVSDLGSAQEFQTSDDKIAVLLSSSVSEHKCLWPILLEEKNLGRIQLMSTEQAGCVGLCS